MGVGASDVDVEEAEEGEGEGSSRFLGGGGSDARGHPGMGMGTGTRKGTSSSRSSSQSRPGLVARERMRMRRGSSPRCPLSASVSAAGAVSETVSAVVGAGDGVVVVGGERRVPGRRSSATRSWARFSVSVSVWGWG